MLHVHKTRVRNLRGSSGNGINIAPSLGSKRVFIGDSYITDNGTTNQTAGILVRPTGGAGSTRSILADRS